MSKPGPAQRILGIDPGLRTTGFGVIEASGNQLRYIASGVVKSTPGNTTNKALATLPARIGVIFDGVREVVREYQPHCAALEIVFVNVNPQSTLLLGQARGAALAALVSEGLTVHEYTALQLKQAITGHGKAAKTQVQEMVKRLLNLPVVPAPDPADALGVAICHHHHHQLAGHAGSWQAAIGHQLQAQMTQVAQIHKGTQGNANAAPPLDLKRLKLRGGRLVLR